MIDYLALHRATHREQDVRQPRGAGNGLLLALAIIIWTVVWSDLLGAVDYWLG